MNSFTEKYSLFFTVVFYGFMVMGYYFTAAAIYIGLFLGIWFLALTFLVFGVVTGLIAYALKKLLGEI